MTAATRYTMGGSAFEVGSTAAEAPPAGVLDIVSDMATLRSLTPSSWKSQMKFA